jgi:FHA domain-containing protein
MLSLKARVIHLDGRHSDVDGWFGPGGGSIGRDAKCDMVLPDPDRRISRLQAQIIYADGQYAVRNASTSNPMYVNGVELTPGSSQTIFRGDDLRAGSYVIAVTELTADIAGDQDGLSTSSGPFGIPPADASGSEMDPLRARGSHGRHALAGDIDPFADLVPEATSGGIGNEPNLMDPDRSSFSAVGEAVPGLPAGESAEQNSALYSYSDGSDEAYALGAPSATEFQQSENREDYAAEPAPDPSSGVTLAARDKDPFGDILAQARPLGFAANALSPDFSVNAPLQSRHNLRSNIAQAGSAGQTGIEQTSVPGFERVYPGAPSGPEVARQQPAQALNPFAPQRGQNAGGRPSPEPWATPLSALAGDPFADLMGAPVETHIARVPVSTATSRKTTYIPDDFNPLGTGGVAHRNSSDPLTPLGRNTQGLTDVVPERTIDAIYAPGAESASALAADPLNEFETRTRALQVGQNTDPMKLFADRGQGVNALLSADQASSAKSASDHTLEMSSFFRAPTARPDTADLGQAEETGAGMPGAQAQIPSDPASQQAFEQDAGLIIPADDHFLEPDTEESTLPDIPPDPIGFMADPLADQEPPDAEQGLSSLADYAAAQTPDTPPEVSGASNAVNAFLSSVKATRPAAVEQLAGDKVSTPERAEDLMSAFKRGAGLQDWSEQSITPALMETIGRMLQATTQGMVSLLAMRATVKQEIHLSVTLINPKSNNPLKFLPDGHTALLQMLGPRIPGFMAPIEAMEEAFEDLNTHQTGIAAGTQAAIKALFLRFDPYEIESQNPQNGVSTKISRTLYDARLWNAYKNQYKLIKDEVKDDFFSRLGADFHEAYNREYENDSSSSN